MSAADFSLPWGMNWYDVVCVVALAIGVWTGIRTGLSGEIIRVIGVVLALVVGLKGYEPAGAWLRERTPLEEEVANLVAFVGLVAVIYGLSLVIRLILKRRKAKLNYAAVVENFGGAVAGVLRMAAGMVALTVMLCMMRSPWWHEQVGKRSRVGSYVVAKLPAVAAVVEKKFPEKMIFFKDIKRPSEPTTEEGSTTNKP